MDQQQLFIKMALTAWEQSVTRTDKLFSELSDEQLAAEVAPGRNSGIYLLGHLTAVSDYLFTLFGIGERLYPQLEEVFLKNADKSGLPKPSVTELRAYWKAVNDKLLPALAAITEDSWFERHTAVTPEDFIKEPQRNKLNVLLNRTNHQEYHRGQIKFLS